MSTKIFRAKITKQGNGFRVFIPADIVKRIKKLEDSVTISYDPIFEKAVKKDRILIEP